MQVKIWLQAQCVAGYYVIPPGPVPSHSSVLLPWLGPISVMLLPLGGKISPNIASSQVQVYTGKRPLLDA
jgi:hypothetical protein